MNSVWNSEEVEYLKQNYSSLTNKEISVFLQRTEVAIGIKAQRLGLKKPAIWDHKIFCEYVEKNGNGEYEVLNLFKRMEDKISLRHKNCGKIWVVVPSSFVYGGNRCGYCSSTKKITQSEFKERLYKINKEIEVLGIYINTRSHILCRCKIHDFKWNPLAHSLLDGEGCPKCAGLYIRTENEFLKELSNINKNILILGKYHRIKTKVRARCLLDEYEWDATPSCLLNGVGCPKCGGVAKYSTKEFIEKMFKIQPNIKILGEYIDHYTKIEIQCLLDGYVWFAAPHTLFEGVGCPCCCGSKGEKKASKYFDKRDIQYQSEYFFKDLLGDCNLPLRFDFAIFKNKNLLCLVEIDGEGHRKPIKFKKMSDEESLLKFNQIKRYEKLKNDYCELKNIKLIRIYYDSRKIEEIDKNLEKELSPFLERR